jgi:hypothetical protein
MISDLDLMHEAAHLAAAEMRNVNCDSVEFFDGIDCIASCVFDYSNPIDDAVISLAPLAVGDSPSTTDMDGITPLVAPIARHLVGVYATEIRARARKIVDEQLHVFAEGGFGKLLNPLTNPVFVGG